MTNFFRTTKIFFDNPYSNPYVALSRHCWWQFRKVFNLFPCKIRMGRVELVVPNRLTANGSVALANAMGYYDPNNMFFIEEVFSKRVYDAFLDVGANLGFYSLITASCGHDIRIYAFEPHPYTFSLLMKNVSANHNEKQISCYQYALGDHDGSVHFSDIPGDPENQVLDFAFHDGSFIEVDLYRGDHFCQEMGILPQVIKIDVEGYENQVLDGFSSILKEVQILFVECWEIEKTIKVVCDTAGFIGPFKLDFKNRQFTPSNIHHEDWIFINPLALRGLENLSYSIMMS
jgi:FkbM family methyltransferase